MPPAPWVGNAVAKWRGVSENCGCQVAKWRCVSENRPPRRLPEAGPGGAQEAPEIQKSLPWGSREAPEVQNSFPGGSQELKNRSPEAPGGAPEALEAARKPLRRPWRPTMVQNVRKCCIFKGSGEGPDGRARAPVGLP